MAEVVSKVLAVVVVVMVVLATVLVERTTSRRCQSTTAASESPPTTNYSTAKGQLADKSNRVNVEDSNDRTTRSLLNQLASFQLWNITCATRHSIPVRLLCSRAKCNSASRHSPSGEVLEKLVMCWMSPLTNNKTFCSMGSCHHNVCQIRHNAMDIHGSRPRC